MGVTSDDRWTCPRCSMTIGFFGPVDWVRVRRRDTQIKHGEQHQRESPFPIRKQRRPEQKRLAS